MHGTYEMVLESGERLFAEVAPFVQREPGAFDDEP